MKRLSGYDDNCFMKKIFCFVNLIVLSFFFSLSSFALDREPYLTLGLGTGCIVYGDDVETSISGSSRAIATTDALIHLPLAEQLNFMAGTDLVGDFVISGSEHFLRYDYAFLGGLEVLTPLTGLSLSVSYAIGRRTDFVALKDENDVRKNSVVVYAYDSFAGEWGPGPELVAMFKKNTGLDLTLVDLFSS